jgi:prephenate dehydrogenase
VKVAIIGGSGKMGRWFAQFLLKDGKDVIITGRDQRKLAEAGQQLGVEVATNVEAVKNANVIVLSVPIDNLEEVVEQLSPYIHSRQAIIDITSIRVFPVEILHRYIKSGLVLGVHPMFGPGATGIVNHNFVLTPTNDAERDLAQKVKEYLEARGARTMLMTPGEHDEMMSIILGLSHFIGLVSADTLLSFGRLRQMEAAGGISYKVLLMLAESVILEAPEFYAALQMSLPDMVEIEALFQRTSETWANLVKNRDRQEFIQRMSDLKQRFKEKHPDFDKTYGNIYKLVE